VERGPLENTIAASGLVTPSYEQQLNAPIGTEIEEVLLRSGARVEGGDLIMRLNREFIQLDLNSRVSQLALSQNSIDLLELELQRDLQELEYDDQIKGLQVAAAEARLADARRLQEIGGATAEEVEQAQTALDILQLEKRKLENELAYRRASLAGRVREVELQADIEQQEVAELERKLGLTEVKAPGPGVITWVNERIGEQVPEGSPLVRIADLRSFHIEATCSDRYAEQVKLGQPVRVRLNDKDLLGQITTIKPAVANNTLEFTVSLEKPDDPQLRPNMRLEVYVITGRKEDVLRVRQGPAFTGGLRQQLFVLRGEQAVRTDVRVGISNGEYVELMDDALQAGDRIIISDMQDYEHLETIQLN
jgi:HlyD family secretion protein